MSNLINKSNHPVQIKKIKLQLWSLRSEIEAAIAKRLAEHPDKDISEVDIEDIKTFYQNYLGSPFAEENDDEDEEDLSAWGEVGLDPNAESSDGEEEAEKKSEEESAEEAQTEDAEEKAEDEEEEEEEGEEKDDTTEQNEADAKALADEMLDQSANETAEAQEAKPAATPFVRIKPKKDKIIYAEILLSDVNMEHALIFTSNRFVTGQNVVTEFQITKPFKVTGEVVSSQNIGRNSKIIKEYNYPFRTLINFNYLFPSERSSLRDFLTSIEPEIPAAPKKIKRDDEDEDDFDDLGF